MTQTNSVEMWDGLWRNAPADLRKIVYSVYEEEHSSVWFQLKSHLVRNHGQIDGLEVIELGAGSGTYGAILARAGAAITVLDYSEAALTVARTLYEKLGITARYILADALTLPADLRGKYDVSMSFGLAEHFEGESRTAILRTHFDLLKPGGTTLISVPNLHCLPYRIWKWKREVTGKWRFGLELPFSRREFEHIAQSLPVAEQDFVGSSFRSSFNFVFPFRRIGNSLVKRFMKQRWMNASNLKQRRPGRLDAHLGYALIYVGRKRTDQS